MMRKRERASERERERGRQAETNVEVAMHVRIMRVWNLTFGLISRVIILPRFRLPRNPRSPRMRNTGADVATILQTFMTL